MKKVKVKVLKDFIVNDNVKPVIGQEFNMDIDIAKDYSEEGKVEIIETKEEKAKYISDKQTLENPKVKNMGKNLNKNDLKLLNVNVKNVKKIQKEENRKEEMPIENLRELENPDLLKNIIEQVQLKVVGEDESIKSIFLCSCGRLVENNHLASFNLLVNSKSGSGKDFITTATTNLWDNLICIKRTRISPTAFTYWHSSQIDPEWTWDGKILVLEDISENVLNSDVFKVMQSSGSIATIVINNKAVDLEIKGKPVIIITTAKASPDFELIRRNSICQLDESKEQTRKILKEQTIKAMQGIVNKPNDCLVNSLKHLKRVKVKIPYANLFLDYFPPELVMRTSFNRFLDFIKASASLHQFQREIDKEGFVLATGDDYNIAREINDHLTKGNSIPLTRDQKDILDVFQEVDKLYSVDYINSKIPLSDKWLRIQLDKLVEMGFLEVDGIKDKIYNKTIRHYKKLGNLSRIFLLKFEELSKKISIVKSPEISTL